MELNYDIAADSKKILRFNKAYNYDIVKDYLLNNHDEIASSVAGCLDKNDIDNAVKSLHRFLQEAHKIPGARKKRETLSNNNNSNVNELQKDNESYNNYKKIFQRSTNIDEINNALNAYINDKKYLGTMFLKMKLTTGKNLLTTMSLVDCGEEVTGRALALKKKQSNIHQ